MKVLKHGKQDGGWSKECHCTGAGNGNTGCGAKLLVELNDVFRTESHARDETTTYITFRCPECGTMTDLADNETRRSGVPQGVWDKAKTGVHHPSGGYCHPEDPARFKAPKDKLPHLKDEG